MRNLTAPSSGRPRSGSRMLAQRSAPAGPGYWAQREFRALKVAPLGSPPMYVERFAAEGHATTRSSGRPRSGPHLVELARPRTVSKVFQRKIGEVLGRRRVVASLLPSNANAGSAVGLSYPH